MTNNEIVKAWISVIENKRNPTEYLINATIDSINRLTAEGFRQQAEINVKNRLIDEQKAEIERLKNQIFCIGNECDAYKDILETAVTEAYKECIEKVKEKSKKTEIVCSGALITTNYTISAKNLDNLLKEW